MNRTLVFQLHRILYTKSCISSASEMTRIGMMEDIGRWSDKLIAMTLQR